ncbi:MAG: dihydropteroate synthase [Anaerolineales bacterium]|jgi:dihydropteroate synthase|nr:dihydropteroate synthase [Anaerolineales bacterium]MDX9936633.1 dihydropteroate synthase [Anaerolineales bacterium]GER78180.1 dihydropteroate synthase [Candidatus Denitrolinea symbiosum]
MKSLQVADRTFHWGARTYVMGVLNVTPDSFSGDGIIAQGDAVSVAVEQARAFLAAGCDILDVGGESTRPGSQPVDAAAEKGRVIPVIEAILREFPDALISIDTYKAEVAEAALTAGARIVNDVWALRADPRLGEVVSSFQRPVILMHNRSNPASVEVKTRLGSAYVGAEYENLIEDVKRELMDSVDVARRAGIPDERVILDPGIGFGKTVAHNLELIRRLDEIRALGFPVLLGPSRKSFIGYTLDLPPDQRVEGTAAAVAVGITRGADIVRVHDVLSISRVVKMTDAIVRT